MPNTRGNQNLLQMQSWSYIEDHMVMIFTCIENQILKVKTNRLISIQW